MRVSLASLFLGTAMAVVAPIAAVHSETVDRDLVAAVKGEWREPEARLRDDQRHPVESLSFWGLKPGMAILEIQPGRMRGGPRSSRPTRDAPAAASPPPAPTSATRSLSQAARQSRADFEAHYAKPRDLRQGQRRELGPKSAPAARQQLRLHPDRTFHPRLDAHAGPGREDLQGVLRRAQAGRHPGGRTAPREPRHQGPQGARPATSSSPT